MNAAQYLARVLSDLSSEEQIQKTSYNGAFLTAALAIIEEVESPMKEQALVQLAVLERGFRRKQALCGRRAA
jgi:hypothetical protein